MPYRLFIDYSARTAFAHSSTCMMYLNRLEGYEPHHMWSSAAFETLSDAESAVHRQLIDSHGSYAFRTHSCVESLGNRFTSGG